MGKRKVKSEDIRTGSINPNARGKSIGKGQLKKSKAVTFYSEDQKNSFYEKMRNPLGLRYSKKNDKVSISKKLQETTTMSIQKIKESSIGKTKVMPVVKKAKKRNGKK